MIKGVLDSDKKKSINKKINVNDDNSKELTEKMVSKLETAEKVYKEYCKLY